MKVVEAKTEIVRIPTRPFFGAVRQSGFGAHPVLETVVLSLRDDEGRVGLGEFASMYPRRGPLLQVEFDHVFAPLIVGRDPRDVPAIMNELEALLPEARITLAGVEMALLDLTGQAAGVPVYVLLGGRARESVPLSYSISWGPADQAAALAKEKVDEGYRSIKLKVGRDHDNDVALVKTVREAIGPSMPLRVDANMRWPSPKDAVRTILALDPYDVAAVEQPLAPDDLAGHAALVKAVRPKIMLDEGVWTSRDLLRAIQADAVEAVSVYVTEAGGLREAMAIFAMAKAAHLPCAIGSMPECGIGTAAQIHVGLAAPAIGYPCDTCGTNYLADDVTTGAGRIEGGTARPNNAPGLGVQLDPSKMDAYRVAL